MGIVGCPNVGKSSLFNALSKLQVPAENFPFCTIDPSVARLPVPDKRFKDLVAMYKPKSEMPAMLTATDIAGLVRGASEGAGLGNEFLSHIGAVDGIYHVCRAFEDKEITHVEESVDPIRDMAMIHEELQKKDAQQCATYIGANKSSVEKKVGGKEKAFDLAVVERVHALLTAGKDVRSGEWDSKDVEVLNRFQFITAKPMIYLVNISKKAYLAKGNKWLPLIDDFVKERGCGDTVLPFSVTFEQEAIDAETAGGLAAKQAYFKEQGARTMLPKIIKGGYEILSLIHYFTSGKDEVRAWTIKRGTLAPQAAGVIHSDFEKGFISADVMSYEDLMELKSEAAVRAAGKMNMKGKVYEVLDGDIMHFKFNN